MERRLKLLEPSEKAGDKFGKVDRGNAGSFRPRLEVKFNF